MIITEAETGTFDSLVDTEYAVVDCYGDYCGACVMLEPVFRAVASDMAGIRFLRINALPTLLFMRGGREVWRVEGSMGPGELRYNIAQMLYH